ncbi:MAG: amino acid ABC transporter permease [Alphaproteobacteria bacterium]
MTATPIGARPERPGARRAGMVGLWRNAALRGAVQQVAIVVLVVGGLGYFAWNASDALQRQGVAGGFGYLSQEAGFAIGESPIGFEPSHTYLRAFVVGLLNTLKVSALAIVGATVVGVIVGLMRLSPNWGLAKLAQAYVEIFRNTPQLLQMILWYWIMTRLPGPRAAYEPLPGLFLSNRGIQLPWLADDPGWPAVVVGTIALAALAIAAAVAIRRRWRGHRLPLGLPGSLVLVPAAGALILWLAVGAPSAIDWPALRGLNFRGGVTFSPEFTALFLALSLYIAAFVAEIVRSGIQSLGRGQIDAGRSLGLSRGQIIRLILIPQALRVMIPPLAAQYVSLVKNSSLAVAIGYPDVVNVSNTMLVQSGHVVEAIAMMSAVYLVISLVIAVLMNWFNRSIQLK